MDDFSFMSKQALQRVEQHVQHRPCLQEIISVEPDVLALLKLAATQERRASRWQQYELLKNVGTSYVGWKARNEDLRATRCYEDYVEAIDVLLPAPEIEDENRTDLAFFDDLEYLRDTVRRMFPHVQLPEIA